MSEVKRVLVADDNVDTTDILSNFLQLHGFEVRTALDGLVALETYRFFRPDVVILDVAMPALDGYEVCRRIRKEPNSAATLIVIISGFGRPEDKTRSIEVGANYHFLKPAPLDEILALIK